MSHQMCETFMQYLQQDVVGNKLHGGDSFG